MQENNYKIVRYYEDGRRPRTIKRGLTLEQARKHCEDPETSSMTAKNACNGNQEAINRWHEKQKHWFDGFTDK